MPKRHLGLLLLVLLCVTLCGCATLIQAPFIIVGEVLKLVGKVLDIAGKVPYPPPGAP